MRGRMRFGDSGQGMLPLMVLVSFSILVITFSLLVPWGSATTEKSQTQTAADAAALAAVQANRRVWDAGTKPGTLGMLSSTALPETARLAGCLSGADADYAGRNGASAVSCQRATRDGQGGVEVLVRNRSTSQPDTGRAEARAVAVMDVDLDGCRWTEPPPPVAGPVPFESTLVCGGWQATYLLQNVPPVYPTVSLVSPTEQQLYNGLEPRLVD